eukprot:Seg731.9 transcript_id=Seg731.9/GoldUCD/mRNA.D3Y31 product="hypothetical protein" protein_id=Seg731.9/GoldUCD/D3Y31
MEFKFISMILLTIVLWDTFAQDIACPNRHYCDTNEIKYRAFSAINDTYLNNTDHVIRSLPIKNQIGCKRECVRLSGCQSSNHFQPINSSVMMCDLIAGNRWSNASKLIPRINSTHFFIQSPCASNPCLHNGTCISLDQQATFKCACANSNYTTHIEGEYCEIIKVAEQTAKVYYNFDQENPIDLKSKTNQIMTAKATVYTLHVPERKSPVLYIPGTSEYITASGYQGQCVTYPLKCQPGNENNNGLSISIWFKIFRRTKTRFQNVCHRAKAVIARTSLNTNYHRGFEMQITGCEIGMIRFIVKDGRQRYDSEWGDAHNETFYKRWTHVVGTYAVGTGSMLYINGNAVAHTPNHATKTSQTDSASLYFGRSSGGNFEVYIDDFAVWYNLFTIDDVKAVYKEGIRRNQH